MDSFVVDIPTKLLFGPGMLQQLHVQKLPGKKALVVISSGKSTRANGYLDALIKELDLANVAYTIFDKVQANPTVAAVNLGVKAARDFGADCIIGLGGGSVMDAAKAIAVMAVNDGQLWDYVTSGTGKGLVKAHKALPIVAITTTAGTGSEVDGCGVITNQESHEKIGIKLPDMFPTLSIVDPQLMLTVPPRFTVFQGFDALFHSMESYVNKKANLLSDTLAERAIRAVAKYLPIAFKDGSNLEARTELALANTLSGYVMVLSGCVSQHAMEHAMSAYHEDLPHGAGLILLCQAYFGYMADKHVCDNRLIRMAQLMGKEDADKPEDLVSALTELMAACKVDTLKFSDYGITPDEFPKMADNAATAVAGMFKVDRRPMSREECIGIYKAAYR